MKTMFVTKPMTAINAMKKREFMCLAAAGLNFKTQLVCDQTMIAVGTTSNASLRALLRLAKEQGLTNETATIYHVFQDAEGIKAWQYGVE